MMRTTSPGILLAFMDGKWASLDCGSKAEKVMHTIANPRGNSKVVTRAIDELRFTIGTIVGNQ